MSTKDNYTPEEWQLLIDVPPMVGTAVMVAGKSGLGSMKEAFAVASGVLGARTGYEDNELIQALVDARMKDGERSVIEGITDNPYRQLDPSELANVVADKCVAVSELLQAKSNEAEATAYKHRALDVGLKVANAAKEGGFLGIGGERVSEAEQTVLDQVRLALG